MALTYGELELGLNGNADHKDIAHNVKDVLGAQVCEKMILLPWGIWLSSQSKGIRIKAIL